MKRKIGLMIYHILHYLRGYLRYPLDIFFKLVIAPLFFIYWKMIAKDLQKRRNYSQKPRLVWGTTPILNNKYWSQAMKAVGYLSVTIMKEYYGNINKAQDFDFYYDSIQYKGVKRYLNTIAILFPNKMDRFLILDEVIKNYDIIHIPFSGAFFWDLPYWDKEILVMKQVGMKIVVLPFGGDFYRYSRVLDKSWQHGLLAHYPYQATIEDDIEKRVALLTKNADCIMAGFQFDGLGRWDILPYAIYPMDCNLWQMNVKEYHFDGKNGVVRITHAPNHRGIKGTEFIIQAVEELQQEGLQVELILIEKKQNDEVRAIMQTKADIHVEQLLLSYALSGIEGMASGLPVLACLDNEAYTRIFRRFSYLNECPILNTTPESIKNNLRVLITNPLLRKELGRAGREYALKYHSFEAMQFIFSKIYDKIWHRKDVDLMNLFHPVLKGSYNNSLPLVKHPLTENRLGQNLQEDIKNGKYYL
jgi:glycosyltransferase involved in cell wall biosynthesis